MVSSYKETITEITLTTEEVIILLEYWKKELEVAQDLKHTGPRSANNTWKARIELCETKLEEYESCIVYKLKDSV